MTLWASHDINIAERQHCIRTSDQTVGAQEQLGVQVHTDGHDGEDPQTEFLTMQEEGRLGVPEV